MTKNAFPAVAASVCATILCISAGPALAAPESRGGLIVRGHDIRTYEQPVWVVRYGDLNLARAFDQRRLNSRVARAVTSICGSEGPEDAMPGWGPRECRQVAFNSARPQITAAIRNAYARQEIASGRATATKGAAR